MGYELFVIGGSFPGGTSAFVHLMHVINNMKPHVAVGWILLLVYFLLTESIHALKSCAPPRFDVFLETMASSWHVDDETKVQVVQEVMRSCGGAVQGVREIPLVSSLYLNRANDGFVFFDNGSYTHGPVQLRGDNNNNNIMTTNLTLCNTKSRVLLSCTLDMETSISILDSVHVVHQARFGDKESTCFTPEDFACEIVKHAPHDNVIWHHQVQCQMPSLGQPWVLQRAKWESQGNSDDIHEVKPFNSNSLEAWTRVQLDRDDNDATETSNGALTWTAGVLCRDSGSVKLMTRKYSEKGMLSFVSLQAGRILETKL
jgi:hypothetical protein